MDKGSLKIFKYCFSFARFSFAETRFACFQAAYL